MSVLRYLLLFIPLTILGHFLDWSQSLMFFMCCLAIVPLAGYLGVATEEIAVYTGPKMGGFLNATFGNATELIIAFFALKAGLFDVVKASLAGSVLGNILFVLGFSIFLGGLKHKELHFDANLGKFTATMLMFAIVGLAIPAVFTYSIPDHMISTKYESFSTIVSIVLLSIYVLGLVYSFRNHADLYGVEHAEDMTSEWSKGFSIFVMAVCTVFIAIESELLVGSIVPMTEALGIKKMFVGLILIPIVGNAAEHTTAVVMAIKNKMDIAIEIAVGSCLQIALFVAPLLVLLSLFFVPMSIVFLPIELFVFAASVTIATRIVSSGKTNWLEGLLLLAIYAIVSVGFFLI
jgi:Ca2+:H+ antiporter